MSAKKQFCFCRRGDEGFMIFCDRCNLWCHGSCVNITEKQSKNIHDWFCMWCNQSKKAEEDLKKDCLSMIKREIALSLESLKYSTFEKTCDNQLLFNELRSKVNKLGEENEHLQPILRSKEQEMQLHSEELEKLRNSNLVLVNEQRSKVEELEEEKKNLQLSLQSKEQEYLRKENQNSLIVQNLTLENEKLKEDLRKVPKNEESSERATSQRKKFRLSLSLRK